MSALPWREFPVDDGAAGGARHGAGKKPYRHGDGGGGGSGVGKKGNARESLLAAVDREWNAQARRRGHIPALTRVRVRGIASTAVSKWAVDTDGLELVDASSVVRTRLDLRRADMGTKADVSVTDMEHGLGLVAEGALSHVLAVRTRLASLTAAHAACPSLPCFTLVAGRVLREVPCDGRGRLYVVELGAGLRGLLKTRAAHACGADGPVRVFQVNGASNALTEAIEWAWPLFSTRDPVCSLVEGAGGVMLPKGVRMDGARRQAVQRSVRKVLPSGTAIKVYRDVPAYSNTIAACAHLRTRALAHVAAPDAAPGVLLTSPGATQLHVYVADWEALDALRRHVDASTLHEHHAYKRVPECRDVVDFLEQHAEALAHDGAATAARLASFAAARHTVGGSMAILHQKMGSVVPITLKPGTLHEVHAHGGVTLHRPMRAGGVYDGMRVRKEDGDYDRFACRRGSMALLHRYYSRGGALKGVYANINLPALVRRDSIAYLDLEVDVLQWADGRKELIDVDDLEKYRARGLLSPGALQAIDHVIAVLMSDEFDLRDPDGDAALFAACSPPWRQA